MDNTTQDRIRTLVQEILSLIGPTAAVGPPAEQPLPIPEPITYSLDNPEHPPPLSPSYAATFTFVRSYNPDSYPLNHVYRWILAGRAIQDAYTQLKLNPPPEQVFRKLYQCYTHASQSHQNGWVWNNKTERWSQIGGRYNLAHNLVKATLIPINWLAKEADDVQHLVQEARHLLSIRARSRKNSRDPL